MKLLKLAAFAIITTFFIAVLPAAYAAKFAPLALSAGQQASIVKINNYINSFQSLKCNFVQISPRGQTTQGVLFISKPGKLRFDYAAPNPLLIVSDGKWLTIKDRKRERGDQFPLSATPLRLVVSPKIDLLAETDVIGFEQKDGLLSVSLADRKDKLGGFITLIFDETRNELQQWVIVDGKDRHTTVQLANIETGGIFDPKLFIGKINRGDGN